MGIDWGDAPTWAGAAFAAAAAFGALMTMKSQRDQIGEQRDFIADQRKVLGLQERELTDVALSRRQEQARCVSLTVDTARVTDEQGTARRLVEIGWRWVATVRNESRAPLYDVRVRVGEDLHESARPLQRRQGDGEVPPGPVEIVKIGGHWEFRSSIYRGEYNDGMVRPVVLFKDESGVEWHLDEHGALSELGSE